jgi:hypothetical protein
VTDPNPAPPCQFDDCDSPEDTPGVAVVPLVSTGMTRPYDWVIACAGCVKAWQDDSYNAGREILRLLPPDTDTQWTIRVNGKVYESYAGITTEANCRAIAADPPLGADDVVVVSRRVGPWVPVPTTKETPR